MDHAITCPMSIKTRKFFPLESDFIIPTNYDNSIIISDETPCVKMYDLKEVKGKCFV